MKIITFLQGKLKKSYNIKGIKHKKGNLVQIKSGLRMSVQIRLCVKAYVPNGSTPLKNLELYECGISPMRCQDISGIGKEASDLRFEDTVVNLAK